MTDRACQECGTMFTPNHPARKLCGSAECVAEAKRRTARESYRRRYRRADHPERVCDHCGVDYKPRISTAKFCGKACQEAASAARLRAAKASTGARCYKCRADLGVPARRGRLVCESCRVDRRERGKELEQRRRLRKFGITQAEYDRLWESQGCACAICGRVDEPDRGWAIDHCHASGAVRGILCGACNMGIGQLREDPRILAAAVWYLNNAGRRLNAVS